VTEASNARKLIAIVEDDASMAEMLSDMLSPYEQWQLHFFSDGLVAKNQLPDIDADLILLDIGLPSLDGASLYKMLRGHSNTRHIPIIVITGNYDWELHRMGLYAGMFLHKPFKKQELLTIIQAFLPQKQET
jgi:DNA-binding response OmpR family regulator